MSLANAYSVRKDSAGSIEIYLLRDEARSAEVRVAPSLGHNAYSMTVNGKPVFWSPYQDIAELAAKPTLLGNPLLWPWANRIDGMTFFANGRQYALSPETGNVRPGPNNTPIHGLLQYTNLWKIVRAEATATEALIHSRIEFFRRPELMAQFPFAHSIDMTYRLANGVLSVETSIENLSSEPLPLSLGYHPYFRVTDAPRDQWTVTLAASRKYLLSPRLIPTGETQPNPYGRTVNLAGVVLDDVFDDLIRDADGFARFNVRGLHQTIVVEYGPNFPVAVVYAPAGRDFICFEPMTAITNAFNAAHAGWYKGLQSIAPGATWSETYRIRTEGF